jgi:hypothetical protein
MVTRRLVFTFVFTVLFSVVGSQLAAANDGQPVAIRHWPGGGITVESMWDLSVGIGIDSAVEKTLPKKLDLKLEDIGNDKVATVLRLPNEKDVTKKQYEIDPRSGEIATQLPSSPQSNVVVVAKRASSRYVSISVGGSSIALFTSLPAMESGKFEALMMLSQKGKRTHAAIDLSRIEVTAADCQKIATAISPALMIVPPSITQVGDVKVEAIKHNTVAFAASEKNSKTRFVSLGDKPYEMSDELKELFAKKEAACQASQKFFAGLSAEQMNFKPENDTHTPRWNPEHMMGRELLFFSQIYHAVDPTIPVMNLNPKQMPKDYKFAHPDWTGAEEARQMHRVEAFTRRFAYLLDGMDLDKKAKGSRFWTPRKLLKQMERHYSEHTANVKKKMELPGWPKK